MENLNFQRISSFSAYYSDYNAFQGGCEFSEKPDSFISGNPVCNPTLLSQARPEKRVRI